MSTRRRSRELALRTLYAIELTENPIPDVFAILFKKQNRNNHIYQFCQELVYKAHEHREELNQIIQSKALNWDFERIAIIDRIILRIALSEFLFFQDIPPKVTIDEAIEIAKKYSTEKSGKFINGILDAVLTEWQSCNKIVKSGRGLLKHGKKEK